MASTSRAPPPQLGSPDTGSEVDVEGFLDGTLTPSVLVSRLVEAGLERGIPSPSSRATPGGKAPGPPPEQPAATPPAPAEAAECVLAEFDK